MRCDHLPGNPPPVIQWYANGIPINPILLRTEILYGEEGRYLFIRRLTSTQRQQVFHCEATNPVLNTVTRSQITYRLTANIQNGQVVEYKQPGTNIALVNEEITVIYSAASVDNMGRQRNVVISCDSFPDRFGYDIVVAGGLVVIVSDITIPTDNDGVTVPCSTLSVVGNSRTELTVIVVGRLHLVSSNVCPYNDDDVLCSFIRMY